MIDNLHQAATDKVLDDQVQRPASVLPVAGPSTFTGLWRGLGGIPGGVAQGFGSAIDLAQGTAEVEASQGLVYNPATRSYTLLPPDDSSRKLAQQIASGHAADLFTSDTGDTFRTVAKDYMPDPQTTGTAAQIVAHGTSFLTQAAVSMEAGGPVLGPATVGALSGMQEADKLREQGVDQTTREQAGAVAGVGAGASMLLPMSGATALTRFAKGAAGGAGAVAAQNEAEKLILQHAGYNQVASQYDPLDPTSLALSALVPGVLGAALGHGAAVQEAHPGASPELAAAQAATDMARVDPTRVATLQAEMAKPETTPESRAAMQQEIDQIRGAQSPLDPTVEAAARVMQTAHAMDASRLTPDDDIVGIDQHQRALQTAADQLGAGEPVDVSGIVDAGPEITRNPIELINGPGDTSPNADLTLANLPPVPDGYVRLFRGESPTQGFSDVFQADDLQRFASDQPGVRYTDDFKAADYYRDAYNANGDAATHYIDVPKAVADQTHLADGEHVVDLPTLNRARMAEMEQVHKAMAVEEPAVRANPEAFNAARAEADAAKAEMSSSEAKPPAGPREQSADALGGHFDAAVAQLDPDMLVHMDGLPNAVRLGDLMESVRAEAAADTRDAKLLEMAAQCALSFPAAG